MEPGVGLQTAALGQSQPLWNFCGADVLQYEVL